MKRRENLLAWNATREPKTTIWTIAGGPAAFRKLGLPFGTSGRNRTPISRTPFASPGVGEPEGVIRLEPGARFSATFVRVSEGTIG